MHQTPDHAADDSSDRVSNLLAEVLAAPLAEHPDLLARLCAEHRECADALRQGYSSLQQFDLLRVGQEDAGAAPAATSEASLPRTFGTFRLLEFLGAGGMGSVYRAEDLELKRTVALKLIRGEMLASERTRLRFQRESAALARLDHPGLCTAYRAGTTDGQPWIAMRLVRGTTLAQHIATRSGSSHGRRDVLQIVSWFESIARALATAHAVGVVHRDLKPGNIVLTAEGGPVVIDFGLVHFADAETHLTLSGDHIGTPAYMAPEQVQADGREVAATTDVYALGVTLFEALTGASPYPAKSREELFQCIARGRRRRLRHVAKDLPADLEFVLEKALEVEPARRYASMSEFAEDLRRFRVHEPLLAGPPSTWYRLRKLVRRYPGRLAAGGAVFVTALIGAVVALQFALREQAKVREFDLLSGVIMLEQAEAAERSLYPPWPQKVEAMEAWLTDHLAPLLALKPEVVRTRELLRQRAQPRSDSEREADRRAHPKFAEWEQENALLTSMRRGQAIHERQLSLVEPELPAAIRQLSIVERNSFAWERVAPYAEERNVHGQEATGLAVARAAAEEARGTRQELVVLRTLSWALLTNGQYEQAVATAEQAWDLAGNDNAVALAQQCLHSIEAYVADPVACMAAAERRVADLAAQLLEERSLRFAVPAHALLYRAMCELSAGIDRRVASSRLRLERDLAWARRIRDLSFANANARHTWAEARAAIAAADDVVASRLYAGRSIDLRDDVVMGLVPIGMSPLTKLWEFYDLRSAWDGISDPAAIPIPMHAPDGGIPVEPSTGIVFVLLPGGTLAMGGQSRDPNGPNYDPRAEGDETPHDVALGPFFLARHEMSQAQWSRLCTGDAASRWPSMYRVGDSYEGTGTILVTHPVERVSWEMAESLLRLHGMQLPTEAQWEFGCRAGTRTPWSTGDRVESLVNHANVCDLVAVRHYPKWHEHEAFEDGYAGPAPVGSFRPNRFGFYDMHGNLFEWCRDHYRSYEQTRHRAGDGLGEGAAADSVVCRGGAYRYAAHFSRSSLRLKDSPTIRSGNTGLRAARSLRP